MYLAEDTKLRRKVALKVLPSDLTKNADRRRRFEQEAQSASALNHPNIITIYEIGEQDDTILITMEFIEGETLREYMQRERIPLRVALDITIQVVTALSAAHRAGIIHRDIKPENIMVRPDGYVKVLDFGLAKLTERQVANAETIVQIDTEPGVLMGTVSYMSPEQHQMLKLDARTDIFSFGVDQRGTRLSFMVRTLRPPDGRYF